MTCDQLITKLCKKAEQIVIDHGMLHKDVEKAIRNHLLKKAEALPKIPVLYNDCYGGFGFSEEYELFEREKALCGYEGVMAFGKQLQQQFPTIYKVLYLVEYLELDRRVSDICSLVDDKSEMQWIRAEQQRLEALTGLGTIDTPDWQQYYRAKAQQTSVPCGDLSDRGLTVFKTDLSEDLSIVCKQILHQEGSLSEVPKILQEDILRWAETTMQERKDQNSRKLQSIMRFTNVSAEPSFMKIICSSTPEAWANHRLCRKPKLQLAIAYAKVLAQQVDSKIHDLVDVNDKSVQNRAVWALGSKAASGQYADIQVEWVPQLVTYDISDYDGKQSIHW